MGSNTQESSASSDGKPTRSIRAATIIEFFATLADLENTCRTVISAYLNSDCSDPDALVSLVSRILSETNTTLAAAALASDEDWDKLRASLLSSQEGEQR